MRWFTPFVGRILQLRGRWLGLLVGLVVWLAWVIFGWWRLVLLAVLVAVGYFCGRVLEQPGGWRALVDKLVSDRHRDH